ncbi:unnamed protein product [Echinostoma caproni]|uniref:Titin n=1 Tax=Echinostoma caproni TaxID=27848 RepID=A0A183A7L9_9TREM|nr:unnamed protein product [Echinostoma caproni]
MTVTRRSRHDETAGQNGFVDASEQGTPPLVKPESNTSSLVCPERSTPEPVPEISELFSSSEAAQSEERTTLENIVLDLDLPAPPEELKQYELTEVPPELPEISTHEVNSQPDSESIGSQYYLLQSELSTQLPDTHTTPEQSTEKHSKESRVPHSESAAEVPSLETDPLSEGSFVPFRVVPSELVAQEVPVVPTPQKELLEDLEPLGSDNADQTFQHPVGDQFHPTTEIFDFTLSESANLGHFKPEADQISETFVAHVDSVPRTEVHSADQTITLSVEYQPTSEESTPTIDYKFQIVGSAVTPIFIREAESSGHVSGPVANDTSMSTTVGVSEIMADPAVQEFTDYPAFETLEKINHESPTHPTGSSTNGVEADYRISYDGGSSYHDDVPPEEEEEQEELVAHFVEKKEEIHPLTESNIAKVEHTIQTEQDVKATTTVSGAENVLVDESPRPSFHEICEELDKKNVVSHLQQRHPLPMQSGANRKQDIVLLNPQTGEVLNSSPHSTQAIHLTSGTSAPVQLSKAEVLMTSNAQSGVNGVPVNGPPEETTSGVAGYAQRSTQNDAGGQAPSRGGAGSGGATGGGAGPSSGGQPVVSNSLERIRQVYNMAECPMAHLTVFVDRALVCRRIRPRFNACEITEVLFEHLSPAIDKDSIRVEIRGAATILDVSFFARSLSEGEDTWSHTINELTTELRHCQRQMDCLSGRIARTGKQRLVLDTFADNLIRRDEEVTGTVGLGGSGSMGTLIPGVAAGVTTGAGVTQAPGLCPISSGAPSPQLNSDHKSSLEVQSRKWVNCLDHCCGNKARTRNHPSTTIGIRTRSSGPVASSSNSRRLSHPLVHGDRGYVEARSHVLPLGSVYSVQSDPSGSKNTLQTLSTSAVSLTRGVNPYDPRNMDTLHRFLNVYEEQAERLDQSLMDANEELEQVQARIEAIEKELRDIELKQDERLARELSVLVEPRETGQVEMLVSYVVGRCGWKPAYDIRIFNSDGTMKIVYYGMVQQATGEEWETRSMTLSTTLPGTGGMVPTLGLQRVCFKKDHSPAPAQRNTIGPGQPPPVPYPSSNGMSRGQRNAAKISGFSKSARQTTTSFHEAERLLVDMDQRDTPTPCATLQRGSSFETAQSSNIRSTSAGARGVTRRTLGTSILFHGSPPAAQTAYGAGSIRSLPPPAGGVISTTGAQSLPTSVVPSPTPQPPQSSSIAAVNLDVPRPPNLIRCDHEPVRVTVGLLDLQPRYEYVTAPKRSLHAYLKATAVNRSDFYILAGQTNIYADNTFIGKSELGAVAQGEEFSCNLGAEHGIKVNYRPLFKYRESSGSGSKHATLTFKQLIEVRNTFDRPIRLMVMDQVPVSGECKIKVNLIEPSIKHPEKYDRNKPIRMNKFNNVEWDLDLQPGETRELTLKYSIEHPANEDLDVTES